MMDRDAHGQFVRSRFGLLTEEDLAAMLNLGSTGTLATWRAEGKGPRATRLGRSVFYTETDVKRWIESQWVD
jgi:predicted DNA-binding transcriptional regulator AlpA